MISQLIQHKNGRLNAAIYIDFENIDVKSTKRAILRICLTPSESFILDALVLDRTGKEIAAAIDSSEDKVKNIIVGLLKKLEAANKAYFESDTAMLHVVKYEEMPSDGKDSGANDN